MNKKFTKRRFGCAAPPHELACLFKMLVRWPEQFTDKRKRRYTQQETFWMFLGQVLCVATSCQEMVTLFLARLASCGQQASANNAAYCKARKRLPQEALDQVLKDLSAQALERVPRASHWRGRNVKVLDGTCISMPDTARNQASYPQPKSQKKGCGFPIMRLAVIFSLSAGAVLLHASGAYTVHERALFHELWTRLEENDILLADRGFCSFADFCILLRRGVDCVMRKHARRGKTSVVEKLLGKNDALMRWNKNNIRPKWLSEEEWNALPQTMQVREVTFFMSAPGFRTQKITVATTLLDPKTYPAESIAELYGRRWSVELFLKDIKITMGMDVLRCKSPEMIQKELTMHLIAYNLLRIVMLEAGRADSPLANTISFKGCLATVRQWAPRFAPLRDRPRKRAALYRALLRTITAVRVPHRPGRAEPRARKRRPKNYPLLTQPRKEFKEISHRNRHRAALS